MIHTNTVQININTGNDINVTVSPNRLIIIPVPNRENKKEIEFVV
jgi:antitoxin component of MazEF toxin-antitoxin module